MTKCSYLNGLLLIGFLVSIGVSFTKAFIAHPDPEFSCNETHAWLSFHDAHLDQLGVCPDDYLIINDVATDDVSAIADECKWRGDVRDGKLTWCLDDCWPQVFQEDYYIIYKYIARNAEQSDVKRFDGCHYLNCSIKRKENVTNNVNVTLTKTNLAQLVKQTEIRLKMVTYSDADRTMASKVFSAPETIYVRISIKYDKVPDDFFVQIYQCWVVDRYPGAPNVHYSVIENGVAASDDEKDNIEVGAFMSKMQGFSFDSFIWTNQGGGVANRYKLFIVCKVVLCNNAADGVDCTDPQFPDVARRRRAIEDDRFREVVAGPIEIVH